MSALPRLAELVELHKNDPFDLIGIATDSDLEDYLEKAEKHDVTWRNAWSPNPSGGLPSVFGVTGFPTVILIDASGQAVWQGHFFEGDADFEAALEKALAGARGEGAG